MKIPKVSGMTGGGGGVWCVMLDGESSTDVDVLVVVLLSFCLSSAIATAAVAVQAAGKFFMFSLSELEARREFVLALRWGRLTCDGDSLAFYFN